VKIQAYAVNPFVIVSGSQGSWCHSSAWIYYFTIPGESVEEIVGTRYSAISSHFS